MRKSFSILLIGIATLAGCNSSTSTSTSTNGSAKTPQTMTATVNGKLWYSGVPNGSYAGAYASHFGDSGVKIFAYGPDSSEIIIGITNLKVGTDSLSSPVNYATYSPNGVTNISSEYLTIPWVNQNYSGWVTITTYDTAKSQINGQFQFVARNVSNTADSITVTNGSFYIVGFSG